MMEAAVALMVNVYIDGYNFYRPIQAEAGETRNSNILRLAWCDYCALAELLTQREFQTQRVNAVKLFTAYISPERKVRVDPDGVMRKNLWLEALHLHAGSRLHVSFGRWEPRVEDPARPKEKLTDVKLAISLVRDALTPKAGLSTLWDPERPYQDDDPAAPFEQAIVISADKDFLPAAEMVIRETRKPVHIVFPYRSSEYHKPARCPVVFSRITEADLRAVHLPDIITRPDGSEITWNSYVQSKGWPVRRIAGR